MLLSLSVLNNKNANKHSSYLKNNNRVVDIFPNDESLLPKYQYLQSQQDDELNNNNCFFSDNNLSVNDYIDRPNLSKNFTRSYTTQQTKNNEKNRYQS